MKLSDAATAIPGVGPALAKRLGALGLHTVADLLFHFPSAYDDFSKLAKIQEVRVGERVSLRGRVQMINSRRAWRRRLIITEALLADDTGTVKAVWFNQPYLTRSLKPGDEIMVAGTLTASAYGLQLEHPVWEPADRAGLHTARLVPRYPLTHPLTQRGLRSLIARVLPLARTLPDWLPAPVLAHARLPALGRTVEQLHAPRTDRELMAARRRIVFDELYLIQLRSKLARQERQQTAAPAIVFSAETRRFVAQLPWALTRDQKVAAWEIIKDLGKPRPMLRLLEGDVGSGKTVVAGIAAFNAVKAGFQAALLAPTEILALQHFQTLTKFFNRWPIQLALLSRGQHVMSPAAGAASTAVIKRELARGTIQFIVGTHTLLQSSLSFSNLGLVIIDEQHRFGVEQRQALTQPTGTALTPHLLSLTATPIPRSLALALYGELELSALKSLPAGRVPITTKIIPPDQRARAYELIRQEISKGNRAFIICPLIDESDTLGVRAAVTEHERLNREVFPDLKLGLLHGRLPAKDKARVMAQFKDGTTPILVATSVVEVGVDVPEATVIAIEGAERFGVAQLHQFRGRVGRSTRPSFCLLFADQAQPTNPRLQALVTYRNGFDLAEFDLKQRGPGDLLGEVQAGWSTLRFAELADRQLFELVRQTVTITLDQDPTLHRWPALRAKVQTTSFHPE